MKILAIYDKSGPKYHRVLMPVHLMDAEVKVAYNVTEELLADCDIVFFNRMISTITIEVLCEFREKYGFKLIADFDDHYRLDKDHFLAKQYDHFGVSGVLAEWIKKSDVVLVTHERLYDELKGLNANIHILPNAIAKTDQFLVKKVSDDYTRLFWAGGITHRRDIELLAKPLKQIDKSEVKLIMGGYEKNNPEWTAMANDFTNHGRWRSTVIEALGVHEYYKMYSLCDIALIPLVDNHFNRNKSNLKILEAANIEAPVVVSKVHPYLGFPEHLVNYVDGYNKTWYSQITRAVKDKVLRREQGIELRNYVDQHYNFIKINQERKQIFDATIEQGKAGETPAHLYQQVGTIGDGVGG